MLCTQRGEASGGKSAPLIRRQRVRLLYPADSAALAGLVVNGEHQVAAEIRGPTAPASALD
jgi:hypothetical protein